MGTQKSYSYREKRLLGLFTILDDLSANDFILLSKLPSLEFYKVYITPKNIKDLYKCVLVYYFLSLMKTVKIWNRSSFLYLAIFHSMIYFFPDYYK